MRFIVADFVFYLWDFANPCCVSLYDTLIDVVFVKLLPLFCSDLY